MNIYFKATFVRQFNKLDLELQQEVEEKIELFKNKNNHEQLKVHKLHGRLQGRYSFSVNYKFRIVCTFLSKNEVALLAIGDHDVYR